MRVFLAGSTGAIGRPLLERLLAAGHGVTAMTRSPQRAEALRARGAEAVVADALDREAVRAAVGAARPEVVINQLTALPHRIDLRRYGAALAPTNRLRREAGPALADAAIAAGARRLISQSVCFMLTPEGPWVRDETAPLWLGAPRPLDEAVAATLALERATLDAHGIEGVVLRYGYFYGPGSAYAPDGSVAEDVRRRRMPVVGSGEGRFSFVHVDDAADATVLALDRGAPGVYNVVDDEPLLQREWPAVVAAALGARKPRHVPLWLGRLAVGPMARAAVSLRGSSNAKAKRELGWRPGHPSAREGLAEVFGS